MIKKASELIFISQILRDGSGTKKVCEELNEKLQNAQYIDDYYEINSLSLTEKTHIASGFNSYVVKLKPTTNTNEN